MLVDKFNNLPIILRKKQYSKNVKIESFSREDSSKIIRYISRKMKQLGLFKWTLSIMMEQRGKVSLYELKSYITEKDSFNLIFQAFFLQDKSFPQLFPAFFP